MIEHSQRMADALKHPHVTKTTVRIENKGELLYEDMPITEGNFTIDDADIRCACTFTCNDPDLTPSDLDDLLQPGNELVPSRGIVFPDGSEELIQLGVLPIDITRLDDSGDGYNLRIDTYDRAKQVSDAKMPKDRWISNNSLLTEAARQILEERAPWAEPNFPDLDYKLPRQVIEEGSDPWIFLRDAFASFGYDLFFDRFGIPTVQEVVADPEEYSYIFKDDELSVLIYIFRQMSRDQSFSKCVVTGESSSGNPVRAEALDLDPSSTTYIYGNFGEVVDVHYSSDVKTERQAQLMANRRLQKYRGKTELLELLIGVNPCLELGDLIRVEREHSRTVADYIISKITIPLIYERGQNLSGKLRRIV